VLQNVQEQILRAEERFSSDKVITRLVRLLHCLSPRITPGTGDGDGDKLGGADVEEVRGIDINVVRSFCAEGLSDEVPALRATLWKLVLGFLPVDVFQWDDILADSRSSYATFVAELLADIELEDAPGAPGGRWGQEIAAEDLGEEAEAADDACWTCIKCNATNNVKRHGCEYCRAPVPSAKAAEKQKLRRSRSGVKSLAQVLDQINKDVFRTRPELDFFARRIDGDRDKEVQMNNEDYQGYDWQPPEFTKVWQPATHHDSLARILLLYARLNPGVQYVQGMNELCAPLYYLFIQDPLGSQHAEADTFFCFSLVMSDMRDAFVKSLDHEDDGMFGRVKHFSTLLQEKDHEVWNHLSTEKVEPLFYAVRWLMLMLTQDLEMPDIFRVWDTLLSDLARPHPFLLYICVAMVILVREALLAGDFSDCLKLLQRYPPTAIDDILRLAQRLRSDDLVPGGTSDRDIGNDGTSARKARTWLGFFPAPDKAGGQGVSANASLFARSRPDGEAQTSAPAGLASRSPTDEQEQDEKRKLAQEHGSGGWLARLLHGNASGASPCTSKGGGKGSGLGGGIEAGGGCGKGEEERPWISSFDTAVNDFLEAPASEEMPPAAGYHAEHETPSATVSAQPGARQDSPRPSR